MPSRLKSLELHGYKTFANRTLFEFAGTVTAIVGPNGSGKSNIADSLRWVLGEQSYSLLRAKKTEDMIFSGSENRPRAGMASATITFDNSDDWLPIDFSEVAITRRAYRDGQNEYLINGQRVRLREVTELLSNSGLAERTYTLVGQGLVDAALALRADERRRLFEEAAGIGLHRSRREEAVRRLDATRRNLERVQDILAELRPRLRSLEKQARRAQEYEQVRADMRVLLREWYGYHWHRAQKELAEARDAARIHEVRLEQDRQEQALHDQKLSTLRQSLQQLRSNLSDWHKRLAELHTRREALGRELAVAEERERSLQAQAERAQVELLNLGEELGFRQDASAAAIQEFERLETELHEARSQAELARQALAERQAERASAEAYLHEARQDLSALNVRQGQLKAGQVERAARLVRTENALAEAEGALVKAESERQAAQAVLQEAQRLEEQARQAQAEAEATLLTHHQRVETSDLARMRVLEERAALQAERERLQARQDVLEQAEAALSGYASGTRILLQAARQRQLQGVQGAMNNYLQVPAEFERAVAAALGEYLDAVLLQTDPEAALDLLQAGAGRGVLVPLEEIASVAPLTAQDRQGGDVLAVGIDVVDAPAELRPALELLLGRVLIVRDRRAARRALKGRSDDVCAVTLNGEVFHASGLIRVGVGGDASAEQTVLGRARQRREMGERLVELMNQSAVLDDRLQAAQAELERLQAEGGRLAAVLEMARKQFEAARQAADQARLAVDGAERQLNWQTGQRQRLHAESAQASQEAQSLTDELAELDQGLTQARQNLRERSAALEELSLDEFQSRAAHWNTLAAVAERALGDARQRRQERQEALQSVTRSLEALARRQEELEASLGELRAGQVANRQAEAEVGAQIKELQALIEPCEAELQQAEKEQNEFQRVEAVARQVVSRAEHFHAQTRITLARRQEALESLRRRIEDDFGLVAFEYVEQVSGPTPLPLAGMVEQLPTVDRLSPEIDELIKRQRVQLRRMGAINPEAQAEYQEVKQRHEFLTEQVADLHQAEQDVREIIAELDALMVREFRKTYEAVATEFREIFTRLFGGGSARLVLTEPDDLTATGIDIEARLPGRRMQGLSLLSGGERSLTATALIFALLKVSPTPFCVLDEVDAMLDEVNVGRFSDLLAELSQNIQFVVITHNRNTVQVADVIYGVTMGRDSVSQVLSLKMDEVAQVVDS
ncbi:MAG: chromosome segregation protein SMC [Anaerolineales bacterium]|nr:chromosome segregation protein SMC [Anaerolineales bacterium]